MNMKAFILGAASYVAIVFPLAILWHLVAFKGIYEDLGYFSREDPIIALGLLSIAVQGLLLSWIFPYFIREGQPLKSGLTFACFMGIFLWSSHVIATSAKHTMTSIPTFLAIESVYLAIQFLLTGLALAFIYERMGVSSIQRIQELKHAD